MELHGVSSPVLVLCIICDRFFNFFSYFYLHYLCCFPIFHLSLLALLVCFLWMSFFSLILGKKKWSFIEFYLLCLSCVLFTVIYLFFFLFLSPLSSLFPHISPFSFNSSGLFSLDVFFYLLTLGYKWSFMEFYFLCLSYVLFAIFS